MWTCSDRFSAPFCPLHLMGVRSIGSQWPPTCTVSPKLPFFFHVTWYFIFSLHGNHSWNLSFNVMHGALKGVAKQLSGWKRVVGVKTLDHAPFRPRFHLFLV